MSVPNFVESSTETSVSNALPVRPRRLRGRRFGALAALLLLVAISILGAGWMAGCGSTADARRGDADLIVWQGFGEEEKDFLEILVKEFEASRNVTVRVDLTPFDQMETKLRSAAIAGQTPDVCFMDALKVLGLAYGEAVVKLDELEGFPSSSVAEFRKEFVGAAYDTNVINVQGKVNLYGLPAQTTCVALFYNKASFRRFHDSLVAAGLDPNRPPADWDELKAYAKAMTRPADGVYGWAINRSLWWAYPMINSYRAEMVAYTEDGKARPAFNDERAEGALQLLNDLTRGGFEGKAWVAGGLGADQGFLEGKYAMCLNGPWMVANFLGAGMDFGVAPIPTLPKSEAIRLGLLAVEATDEEYRAQIASVSNLGGQNVVMFKTCPDQELALDFMLWFTSDEIQRRWCSKLTQIPTRLSAREGLELQNAEYFNVFVEQVANTVSPPLVPLTGKLEADIFNKHLGLMFEGKKTPKAMAADVCAEMDKEILAKMNAY